MRTADVRGTVGLWVGDGITDALGRVLVPAGTRMSAGLCQALVRRGYMQIYALDGIADDVAPNDALRPQTRALALWTVPCCHLDMGRQPHPLEAIRRTVDEVLYDLLAAGGASREFASPQGASEPTDLHSLNVCVYSLVIGQARGVHGEEMRALNTGALLHDIGKVLCAEVCDKPGSLTANEWIRVRQHPVDGFEMLRRYRALLLVVAHIALVRVLGRADQVYSDQEEGPASGDHALRQVLNRWPRWQEAAFAA